MAKAYICDICGAMFPQIPRSNDDELPGRDFIVIGFKSQNDNEYDTQDYDLCPECSKTLQSFIDGCRNFTEFVHRKAKE